MGSGQPQISTYISGCVEILSVKRGTRTLPLILKQAFLKIHAISNGHLNRALKAIEKSGGSPHQDQRGKHEPVSKTPTDKIGLVKEHNTSFPATSSHYSRADNPNRKYLSSQLSLVPSV